MARPSSPKISPRSSAGVWQRVRLARARGLTVNRACTASHWAWVTIAFKVGCPSARVSPSIVNRSFGENGSDSQPVALYGATAPSSPFSNDANVEAN